MDDIFDDQQLLLDKNEMVVSDTFLELTTTAVGAWVDMRRIRTRSPDMCGTAATIAAQFSMLCWSLDAGSDFQIALYHVGRAVRHAYTVSANRDSHIWRAWTAVTLYGAGQENELIIQVNNDAAASPQGIAIAGVGVFTNM
jgi:hypothetical protein